MFNHTEILRSSSDCCGDKASNIMDDMNAQPTASGPGKDSLASGLSNGHWLHLKGTVSCVNSRN